MTVRIVRVRFNGVFDCREGRETECRVAHYKGSDRATRKRISVKAGHEISDGISLFEFERLAADFPGAFELIDGDKRPEPIKPKPKPEPKQPPKQKSDAVLFRNGIGNFVMATPLIQNLNNPTIVIPADDLRRKAVESISLWPVISPDDFRASDFDRAFALWCWKGKVQHPNLIHQPGPDWSSGIHESQTYLDLLTEPEPYPAVIKTDPYWTLRKDSDELLIALVNGAAPKWGMKLWPMDRWATLAKNILKTHKAQFVYLGDKGERSRGAGLSKSLGRHIWNFAGRTTLARSAHILSQCDFLIATDTSLVHIADAVGCRGVALYGPTSWSKNSPRNGNLKRIQSDSGGCLHFPCLHKPEMWKCKRSLCMETITPLQVHKVFCDAI